MSGPREIICTDAIEWLKNTPIIEGSAYIASMPDISEFQKITLTEWKEWFASTAKLILEKTPEEGVSIFYQSDIKVEGTWVDKAFIIQKVAEEIGHELLWHKIVCRYPAGTITFGRPAYSHILCFSKKFRIDISKSTPDVIPVIGDKTWERGMGFHACELIAKFLTKETNVKTLIHPFCGEGGMLAVANTFGLNAIGIERSPKRAQRARDITVNATKDNWELL